jgi:hypothetical protein
MFGEVSEAVLKINFFYEEGEGGSFIPTVKNLLIENVTSKKSDYAVWIKAYEYSPVENLTIRNCNFNNVKHPNLIEHIKNLKIDNVVLNNKLLD